MPDQTSHSQLPFLFDRNRLAQRAARAWTGTPNFVATLVADDLEARLSTISRIFSKAAILGPDARALPARASSRDTNINFDRFGTLCGGPGDALVNPEALDLPHRDYDLVVSLLDLQVVNDVPGFLNRLRLHLAPDGLMLAAAIGGKSLTRLRAAWLEADAETYGGAFARVAPFMDVRDAGGLLQRAGFALPVADAENHTVRYADAMALMKELQTFGASNPLAERPPRPATKKLLARAASAFPVERDRRISENLEIIWMSGWAPHVSQQKPLRPGAGQVSLKNILEKK